MTNVGLIGCGAVAYWCHLPALRRIPGVRVVAAADPDHGALERLRRRHPVEAHGDAASLLARRDLDAVVISVPPLLHADVAVAAAGAGRAFYLEKPIAADRESAGRITSASAKAGVAAAIGFNRRWHPLHRQARGLLRSGAIGEVRAVQMAFCEPAPPQGLPAWKLARATGGGVLLDLASHHVDLVRWFLDDEVEAVEAATTSMASEDDSAWLTLTTRGGVRAQGTYSFRAGHADFLEFLGTGGSLRVDRHRAALDVTRPRRRGYGVRRARRLPMPALAAWWARRLVRRAEDPSYAAALAAFIGQVRGGPALTATLEDGVRSLAVILAAEASARDGTPVRPLP